jgi:hypothetical protein
VCRRRAIFSLGNFSHCARPSAKYVAQSVA